MDKRKPKTKFRKPNANPILDRDDYIFINGKLQLKDSYYIKRGKQIPKKDGD